MNKILGNFYKILAELIEGILSFIITILTILVSVINNVRSAFMIFGIILILALLNPITAILLLSRKFTWVILLIFIVVPFLARRLIIYFKYLKYGLYEYLYDRHEFKTNNRSPRYLSLKEYFEEYYRKKEEERQREYQEYARAQQEHWERVFRDFYSQQGQYKNYQGSNKSGSFYNPTDDFIKEYEKACSILGIEPTTDRAIIQSAYRKMAKKYHPDINRDPEATEKFQMINKANAFLSDENINRYKKIKSS